jgi:hypothetical protein
VPFGCGSALAAGAALRAADGAADAPADGATEGAGEEALALALALARGAAEAVPALALARGAGALLGAAALAGAALAPPIEPTEPRGAAVAVGSASDWLDVVVAPPQATSATTRRPRSSVRHRAMFPTSLSSLVSWYESE